LLSPRNRIAGGMIAEAGSGRIVEQRIEIVRASREEPTAARSPPQERRERPAVKHALGGSCERTPELSRNLAPQLCKRARREEKPEK
jgi:hypothetical protein